MPKNHYIDRNRFHQVMTECKKSDRLTDEAVNFFKLLSQNVARKYYYNNSNDSEDATSKAIEDLLKYWKNFKENNLIKINILRNFVDGEQIIIRITNFHEISFTAREMPQSQNEFCIRDTPNRTIQDFKHIAQAHQHIKIFHDQVKRNLTIMESVNNETDQKSYIQINEYGGSLVNKKSLKICDGNIYLNPAPNAFSYFTSICNNAVMKFMNLIQPKWLRDGKKVSIQGINEGNNGLYSI